MHAPYPQLTPEQRDAIAASGGLPVQVEDPDTHKLYVLVEQPHDALLDEEYIRNELAKGLAAIEAGERLAWDPQQIKQEGRRRRAGSRNSCPSPRARSQHRDRESHVWTTWSDAPQRAPYRGDEQNRLMQCRRSRKSV